jgi:hypothetical protein
LWGGNEGIEHRGVKASSAVGRRGIRGRGSGRGLHTKIILVEPLAPLEVEVAGRIPQRPRPIGTC